MTVLIAQVSAVQRVHPLAQIVLEMDAHHAHPLVVGLVILLVQRHARERPHQSIVHHVLEDV